MKQEQKQLLLKDLSTRLPYGVKGVFTKGGIKLPYDSVLTPFYYGEIEMTFNGYRSIDNRVEFIPYLRPMSSMTEEEEIYYNTIYATLKFYEKEDWLNAHHFDYRIDPSTGKTLIESNLALEAPEDMYKSK